MRPNSIPPNSVNLGDSIWTANRFSDNSDLSDASKLSFKEPSKNKENISASINSAPDILHYMKSEMLDGAQKSHINLIK